MRGARAAIPLRLSKPWSKKSGSSNWSSLLVRGRCFAVRHAVRALAQLAWFSGCVTVISAPLVWHQFHVVSPISVLTNLVLSPFLFVALASGVCTVVLGFIPLLGILFGSVCDLSLTLMHWLIRLAASVPWGHHWLPAPPTWWVITFYIVVAASLVFRLNQKTRTIRYGWIVGWLIAAYVMATTPSTLETETLEATFIDVGHGTCVVLRLSEREVWLYDCGRLGNDTGSSRDIDATLWSLGVTRLQGIILSHADADHFNALPGILRRFQVNQVFTPPGMLAESEVALIAIRRAIERTGLPVRELSDGDSINSRTATVEVLHPPAVRLRGNDNANSMVLRIDWGRKSLILPGDLEPPGTETLIRHDRPRAGGILMAPHHGSLTMDASSVLQWSRPGQTIVSGGRRAGRPEVEQMLSATGSGVHVTNLVGAIRVRIDRTGRIEVRSWSNSPW